MKVIVSSPDRDSDIVDGVLQGDTLAHICLYSANVNRSNKRKWFHIKKGKKQTIFHRTYDRCRCVAY